MGLTSSKDYYSTTPVIVVNGYRYRILDTIGQGGEATVYRCQDPNGAQYALKAFDFSRYSRKKATERIQNFHKETRMLKYLAGRSPHFVRLYDSEYNPTTNTGYMVMELGESSLRDHLIGAPLNDSIRKTCWRQIVAILTTLQDSHVVHADIKPENIILVNNVLKLTDLGIAFRVAGQRSSVRRGNIQGTLDYMAPEVFSHQTGFKSDVWSAGVILYEMTFGRPPYFHIINRNQKVAVIASKRPVPVPPLRDQHLNDCMKRCLHPNANFRPTAYQLTGHPYTRTYY